MILTIEKMEKFKESVKIGDGFVVMANLTRKGDSYHKGARSLETINIVKKYPYIVETDNPKIHTITYFDLYKRKYGCDDEYDMDNI